MSSRELTEWMAYYAIEPWGEERADLRSAIVAATVANAASDPKRQSPFKPEIFLAVPPVKDDAEPLPPEDLRAKFTALMGRRS